MLADMATKIEAARLLTWRAAAPKSREMAGERFNRTEVTRACSMAKLMASECANFWCGQSPPDPWWLWLLKGI